MSTAFALTNLDYAYRRAVPNFNDYFEKWRSESEAFRDATPCLLDVPYDASPEMIRAAHRRLIARVHPDAGGSADLSARVNAARDTLLARRT